MVTPRQPKALLLTPIAPQPTGNGLAMRAAMAVEGLSRAASLYAVVIPVSGPVDGAALTWVRQHACQVVCAPLLDSPKAISSWLAYPQGRLLLGDVPSLPMRARLATPACGEAADELMGKPDFDVIYVLRAHLAGAALPFLFSRNGARMILDVDEDDSYVSLQLSDLHEARNELQAGAQMKAEAERQAGFTQVCRHWFDTLVCSSDEECRRLGGKDVRCSAVTLPNAVSVAVPPSVVLDTPSTGVRLLYLGNLGYLPNLDAAERLALCIFPLVRKLHPDAVLDIVGSQSGGLAEAVAIEPGVVIRGYVDDLDAVYAAADILVVPLRAGGGTRIKILEAAARGLAIVATAKAVEGLGMRAGKHLLVAETDAEMARCVCRLVENHELAHSLRTAAASYVEKHHNIDRITDQLAELAFTGGVGKSTAGE
jgi:hypothetical protein